jgi:hypothetical protein
MNIKFTISIIILTAITYSCSTSRVAVQQPTPENQVTRDYIEKYSSIAVSEMDRTGIPASIKLAQGMIESDFGRSRLAKVGNNHFGIKCHSDWRGPVIYHDDDARGECFRKYNNPEQSYRDHSDFLVNGSRYVSLFSLSKTDYKGWAHGLKRAGYATNPRYADLLIRSIEANGLHVFDRGSSTVPVAKSKTITPASDTIAVTTQSSMRIPVGGTRYSPTVSGRVNQTNRVEFIILTDSDTYETLKQNFNLLNWELEKYNEKLSVSGLVSGQKLYLQPKRNKAEHGFSHHIVKEGETMYSISQQYAIKLSRLYEMNFMEVGTEPETGRKLNIR